MHCAQCTFSVKVTFVAKINSNLRCIYSSVKCIYTNARHHKPYIEYTCKTSRYYNSPIPYLSRLLKISVTLVNLFYNVMNGLWVVLLKRLLLYHLIKPIYITWIKAPRLKWTPIWRQPIKSAKIETFLESKDPTPTWSSSTTPGRVLCLCECNHW